MSPYCGRVSIAGEHSRALPLGHLSEGTSNIFLVLDDAGVCFSSIIMEPYMLTAGTQEIRSPQAWP